MGGHDRAGIDVSGYRSNAGGSRTQRHGATLLGGLATVYLVRGIGLR